MTDISSLTTHAEVQLNTLSALSPAPLLQPPHSALPGGGPQEDDEEDYTIKCICGYFEDDGHTVYCDDCDTWQHVHCYYKDEQPPEVHRCLDCDPRHLDFPRLLPRQKQANGERKVKRPPTKSHKKKVKDAASANGQINGWPAADKDDLTHTAERHSGSPRDQPPPAKRPKTSHRSAHSLAANLGPSRKRAESSANNDRSPSKSPSGSPAINGWTREYYTHEFMQLHRTSHEYTHTEANLHVNIDVRNNLSTWLTDPSALADATNGKAPHEVFQRWDKPMDELTSPEIKKHVDEDKNRTFYGVHPIWQYLTTESDVAKDSYIGELKGHIGHIDDYIKDPANRWLSLRHPAPFVFFHPQLPIYIDTRVEGTPLRYARRSCHPNLIIKTIITEGLEYHFCLVATEDIPAGSELTVGWELEDKVRQLLAAATFASAQTSNGFRLQGRDEDYISKWVNNLLANFGDCACGSRLSCAMGRFDKRAFLPQLDGPVPETSKGVKSKKHKRTRTQNSPLNAGLAINSRSGSEAIKAEVEENGDDSRSVSSRSKHGSRDNTPMTHFSGDAAGGFGTELSDREKRKLMQQEKLFEQLEHDEQHGSKKKKRNSGGSTLNTPSAATSVSITCNHTRLSWSYPSQKQLGHFDPSPSSTSTAFLSGSRYVDPGTSGRDHSPQTHSTSYKRASEPSRLTQTGNLLLSMSTKRVFADASTQTDPLPHERSRAEVNPPRNYVPRTRRLLRAFRDRRQRAREDVEIESNNMPFASSPLRREVAPDAMDIGPTHHIMQSSAMPPPAAPTTYPVSLNASTQSPSEAVPGKRGAAASPDVEMQDAGTATDVTTKPESETDHNLHLGARVSESQPTSQSSAPTSLPHWPSTSESAPSSSPPSRDISRPIDLHVTLPPAAQFTAPLAQMISTPNSASAAPSMLSPMSIPASSSHSYIASAFPTSGTASAAVAPSPVKKKMSLSDWTKRTKAREVERSSPPVNVTDSPREDARGSTGPTALEGNVVTTRTAGDEDESATPKSPKVEGSPS